MMRGTLEIKKLYWVDSMSLRDRCRMCLEHALLRLPPAVGLQTLYLDTVPAAATVERRGNDAGRGLAHFSAPFARSPRQTPDGRKMCLSPWAKGTVPVNGYARSWQARGRRATIE